MKFGIILLLLCGAFSLAADKFLTSCQTVWDANAESMVSLRAEMHMDMDFSGYHSSQKMDIMFLFVDSIYSKMETVLPVGQFTMICHGDSGWLKAEINQWLGGGEWNRCCEFWHFAGRFSL